MRRNNFITLFFCFIFLCQFHSCFSKEWKRAYFASYPRSGNHWLRFLIEEASHIATGSVYCDQDPRHMSKIFPWGGYCCDHGYNGNCHYPTKDDLVFIKTHFPGQGKNKITKFDELPYQVTIRVVRHPVDSFYSYYVKRKRNNVLQEKVPTELVEKFVKDWFNFQTYWNKKKNVITFRYEDILENPFVELKKILKALQYDVTDEDIARAVEKYPPEGFMLKHIDKFTNKDLILISEKLSPLMTQFNYEIPL